MKSLLIFSLLAILTSCGQMTDPFDTRDMSPTDPRQFTTSNPVFDEYRDNFEDDHYHHTGKNITVTTIINFGNTDIDPEKNIIGVCYRWDSGHNEIIINQKWWNGVTVVNKELLIQHELGHCALNLDHDDETISYDEYYSENNEVKRKARIRKLSIMNTYFLGGNIDSLVYPNGIMVNEDVNPNNIEFYEEQLFTGNKSNLKGYWSDLCVAFLSLLE